MSKLPVLQPHPSCDRCDLHERDGLLHPGLPSRIWDGGPGKPRPSRALLAVGSHPGVAEDRQCNIFIGATGQHMNRTYIQGYNLDQYADVYLTNAVRCAPRDVDDIADKHLKACRPWIEEDVAALKTRYKEVVLLLCGEKAIRSVMQEKVAMTRFSQGCEVDVGGVTCVAFATSLPAVLLPQNDPSKILSIREHLLLLWKYLKFGYLPTRVRVPKKLVGANVPDPPPSTRLVALDVETYGAFAKSWDGRNLPVQTVYHPAKSMHWDRVKRQDLVQTCALAWRGPRDGKLRTKVYRIDRPAERTRLVRVLSELSSPVVLGQNIPFDVLFLRAFDKRFQRILCRRACTLYELQVVNFLQNDQRIERSLKNLSLVLSIADYRNEVVDLRKGERYHDSNDPRSWTYNAKDALATLQDYEALCEAITLWYGDETDKWKSYSRDWYNELLWLSIGMSERGVLHNREQLQKVHDRHTRALEYLKARAADWWDWPLEGTGSVKAKERIIPDLIEKWQPSDPFKRKSYIRRIKKTKKTKKGGKGGKISTGKENIWLLKGAVPKGTPDRGMLLTFSRFQTLRKIVDSYTGPLLRTELDKTKDHKHSKALVKGYGYPSWHVVPSYASDDADTRPGGTSQCRITPRDPALQTYAPKIEACQCSRFKGGALVHVDQSQLEIRVATGVFGDDIFMDLYRRQARGEKINVHADTASEIAGRPVSKKTHPLEYHAGKTLNFLVLFLGQWRAFQETCLREVGWDIPDRRAKGIIARWDRRHQGFRKGQRDLIAKAQRQGYIEIPLVGASRTFLGQVEQAYASTIVNLPVQAIAALLTLSAQIEVDHWLEEKRMRSMTVSNTYDEGIWDCPPREVDRVVEKAVEVFARPRLYRDLVESGHLQDVPLASEVEVVYNN